MAAHDWIGHDTLISLHIAGATPAELRRWLRQEKRIKVAHSTVARWMAKHG